MRRFGVVVLFCLLALAACTSESGEGPNPNRVANKKSKQRPQRKEKKDAPRSPSPTPEISPTPPEEEPEERAWWKREIDKALRNKSMSVQVRFDGSALYSHNAHNERVPASTQKLVLSMALFDRFGPEKTFPTRLAAVSKRKGVIKKDLWVIGSGNPAMAGNPVILDQLPPEAVDVQQLVRVLTQAGVRSIEGNVMAATEPFARDWYAPGWKPFFPTSEVGLPTALTFNGNVYKQHYTKRPELKLAETLIRRVKRAGIEVGGVAGAGDAPRKLKTIASVDSPRLAVLARFMNKQSSNFFAEVLGKSLGVATFGEPGTIAKGARAISRYAREDGVTIESHDSSGLSYANQISPAELALLVESSEDEPWYIPLRSGLAAGGQGTLKERLHRVQVRAKTGTLDGISALAGWVYLNKASEWAEFAIMSRGLDKSSAIKAEDRIVRLLHRSAR